MLHYQRLTLDDYVRDMQALLGWRRQLIRACRPLVRAAVLRQSRYRYPEQPRLFRAFWREVELGGPGQQGIG